MSTLPTPADRGHPLGAECVSQSVAPTVAAPFYTPLSLPLKLKRVYF